MIYLDNIIFSLQRSGGISVVWAEHLSRLLSSGCDLRFLEYQGATDNIFRKKLPVKQEYLLPTSGLPLRIQRYFSPHLSADAEGIFHSSYFRTVKAPKIKNVTTVHDFTYEYFSSGLKKFVHCQQKYHAIRNSDAIICVSENTKNDLFKFLPDTDPSKVHVVYNGVSDDFSPNSDIGDLPEIPFDRGDYIVFVGARGGYKNFIECVDCLKESSQNLIVVGGGELNEIENAHIENALGKDHCKYAGRISNQQLNALYNHAKCLIYPSAYEGFGIPILEAQKAGCPVIALKGSSITEIADGTTLLIDSLTPENVQKALDKLTDEKFLTRLKNDGFANCSKYSWDKTFKETLNIYKKLSGE